MFKRPWLHLCALLVLIVSPSAAFATASPWRAYSDPFFHALFRDVDNAPIGVPRAIARDGRGFMWVGYLEGLARWDGVEFKTYSAEADGKGPQLPEPSIATLHADVAGRLWVGTHSQGLVRYDADLDAFVRPGNRTVLDHSAVRDIVDARDGALWVASSEGLAHVDRATSRVSVEQGGWLAQGVEHLSISPSGILWVSRGAELQRREIDGRWTAVDPSAYGGASPIADLTTDEAGRIWVVQRNGGVAILNDRGQPVRRLTATGDSSLALSEATAPRNGHVWIASNEGLFAIDTTTFAVRNVRHDVARSISLPQDDVTAIAVDRTGLLWVGSDSAMAFADLDPRQAFGLSSVFATGAGDGHATPSVVRAGQDGVLWLGQTNDPLQRLDPRTGRLTPVSGGAGAPAPRSVGSLVFTPDGRLLAGAGNGLFEIAPDGAVRRRLSSGSVRRILVAGPDLYLGAADGLDRMRLADPSHRNPIPQLPHGANQSVNSLALSRLGRVWVGTIHGLYRFDPRSGRVDVIREAGPQRSSLDGYISNMHVDRQGRLWVGVVGGLFLIADPDVEHPTIRRFGVADGLPNANIDTIVESRDGDLWVSTDKGIAHLDPVSLKFRRLSEAEGVAFANNWSDGGDVLPGGEVVFAGVGGLTFIEPDFPVQAPTPAVMLTDVRIGDHMLSPGTTRLELKPGSGPLSVSFASPDLAATDRIGFAYRLQGLDNAWTRVAGNRRSAEFSHLPPGRYTLEIRATDRQGVAGGEPRRIEVVAHPSLIQSWWFRSALVLGALAVAVGALVLRHRANKRRQAHLESLVDRRTSELRASQAELERLAYFDPLTGLANRRMFQELLAGMLRPNANQPFALIVADLDRFKAINDSLGHDAGDALLSQVAARLASTVRARDSVCRLGGDEFALLIQDLQSREEIDVVCTRLLAAVAEPFLFEGRDMQTGLSLGVALYPTQAVSAVELYKLADTALYDAKAAGRGVWRLAEQRTPSGFLAGE